MYPVSKFVARASRGEGAKEVQMGIRWCDRRLHSQPTQRESLASRTGYRPMAQDHHECHAPASATVDWSVAPGPRTTLTGTPSRPEEGIRAQKVQFRGMAGLVPREPHAAVWPARNR